MKVLILCLFAFYGYVNTAVVVCNFKEDPTYGYMCEAENLKITSNNNQNQTIVDVIGDHLTAKCTGSVKYFKSENNVVKYFPLELSDFFTLKTVSITSAQMSEIHSSDLKQFGKLRNLYLSNNAITILEKGLFQFNPKLEEISFSNNKIRHIEDGTFKGLEKLKTLFLNDGNTCIDRYETTRDNVLDLIDAAELSCKDRIIPKKISGGDTSSTRCV